MDLRKRKMTTEKEKLKHKSNNTKNIISTKVLEGVTFVIKTKKPPHKSKQNKITVYKNLGTK